MVEFGKYALSHKLGAGGMAEVYLAKAVGAEGLEKTLVIKQILPGYARNPQFVSMFVDEAKIAMTLNHPNIVQVYEFGQVGRAYYLAMEFVNGADLGRLQHALRRAQRRMPRGDAVYAVAELCKGLEYAHRKRDPHGNPLEIVHRDVSPQNLLVSYEGAVRIVDFGIAKARGVADDPGVVRGKFAYMAPEQARAERVDQRSDIYAAGVVLYELLLGRTPYGVPPAAVTAEMVAEGEIPRPRDVDPTLPEELERILVTALAHKRSDRYEDAREMAVDLTRFLYAGGEIHDSGTLGPLVRSMVPPEAPGTRVAKPARPVLLGVPLVPGRSTHTTDVLDASHPLADEVSALAEAEHGVPAASSAVEAELPAAAAQGSPRAMPMRGAERRPVVVVRGDIRGAKELQQRVGEGRARAVLAEYLKVIGDIAYKGSAIPHRVSASGFLLVVGLPLRTADDSIRSVRLGTDVVEATEGVSRDLAAPLQVGVGIATALAMVYSGAKGRLRYELPENGLDLAEQLASQAADGEVLVGGAIYHAARRQYRFDEVRVARAGEVAAGGGEGGGPAASQRYRIVGLKSHEERRQDAQKEVDSVVGREAELAALRDLYVEALLNESTRAMIILGEAGIGKTLLTEAMLAALPQGDHRVFRGLADGRAAERPFGVLAELLRDALRLPQGGSLAEGRRRLEEFVGTVFVGAPEEETRYALHSLGSLVGVDYSGGNFEALEASARMQRTSLSIRRLLERTGRERPVLFVLDDFHHADVLSRDLLLGFLREPIPRRIMLIVAGRPVGAMAPWSQEMEAAGARILELGELSREARQRLALDVVRAQAAKSRAAGDDSAYVPASADVTKLARLAVARAGGSPLFLIETARVLAERGAAEAPRVPATVEGVVASRLDRLSPAERTALGWAAAAGGSTARADLIAAAAGVDVAALLPRLVAQGLLAEVDDGDAAGVGSGLQRAGTEGAQYTFRSSVVRDVAYRLLPSQARRAAHRCILRALQRWADSGRPVDPVVRAHHAAAAGQTREAASLFVAAAERAAGLGAPADGLKLYDRALSLMGDDLKARFDVQRRRAEILRALGLSPERRKAVSAMRRLADEVDEPRLRAEEALASALLHADEGRTGNAQRALERALVATRAVGDNALEAEAVRMSADLYRRLGQYPHAEALARRALQLVGDDSTQRLLRARSLNTLGSTLRPAGDVVGALRAYEEALAITRKDGHRSLEAILLNNLGVAATGACDYEAALTAYKRALVIDRELGNRRGSALKLSNIGQVYASVGDLQRALKYLKKGAALLEAVGDRCGLSDALAATARTYLAMGKPARGCAHAERALPIAEDAGGPQLQVEAAAALADCLLTGAGPERGPLPGAPGLDPERALELARTVVTRAREAGLTSGVVRGLDIEARALAAMGKMEAAAERSAEAARTASGCPPFDGVAAVYFTHYRLAPDVPGGRESLRRGVEYVREAAGKLRDATRRRAFLDLHPHPALADAYKAEFLS